ncbi:MAG: hypothetical protein QM401_02915 [Bacillota bacterium]|nr:hypothetical protein [Bacillota bacterium]
MKRKIIRIITIGMIIYLIKLGLGELDILRTTHIPSFYPAKASLTMSL